MKLYSFGGDLDYHWLRPADGRDWDWRGGAPITFKWRTPELDLADVDRDPGEFVPVDCLLMSSGCDGPILSDFAREALGDLLQPAGEFWPVSVLGLRYWWFNCLAGVDALDRAATEADWDVVSGDWGEFRWITLPRRLAFRPEAVAGAPAVFRVPEFPQGVMLAREAVEDAVTRKGLTGFRLDLVWSAGEGGVRGPAGFGLNEAFEERALGEIARKRARARAVLDLRKAHAASGR
ncbi:MAG TPA: DUF1629 domain-containing protein [Tepidisphaeraceae bacterium]|nr:DUF1629 domain-containing protein [Tepidisphaeraceae bacterium]